MRPPLIAAFAALVLAPSVVAQSVYVDLGPPGTHGAPTAPLAAAAGIAGTWNEVDTALVATGPFPLTVAGLVDLGGAPTGVSLVFHDLGSGFDGFAYDDPESEAGDDALLDDLGFFGGPGLVAIRGLAPGTYEVYTYASVPDGQDHATRITVPASADPAQDVAGGFANGYAVGATHALHRVTVTAGLDVTIRLDVVRGFSSLNGLQVLAAGATGPLGSTYCSPAQLNAAGTPGVLAADGSRDVAANDVTLRASALPTNTFGYFITSRARGFVVQPGGSLGNLCLSGAIGRYRAPGQVLNTGTTGGFSLALDLTQTPTPTGAVTVVAGETWHYQCWFRDSILGFPASNFTDARSITYH